MPYNRFVLYSLLLIFMVSGCAGMDEFLEVNLEDPLVMFQCAASPGDNDTLVLIGIENPNVYQELQTVPMRFYLENENDGLSLYNESGKKASRFLPFARISAANAVPVIKDFPLLKDLATYGIYLQGMKLDEKDLERYTSLGDGTSRNMSERNAEMINDRKIVFINREVDGKKSLFYKKLVANTFTVKR